MGASVALALLSFPVSRWLYFRHWRQMTQQELFEQKMLRWGGGGGARSGGCPPRAATSVQRGPSTAVAHRMHDPSWLTFQP